MRVLLINPSSRGTFRLLSMLLPPLGLLYVAAAIRKRGHRVKVVDRSVDHSPINFTAFDVVGIHSDTTLFNRAMALARQARAAGVKVVMGGPHPCFVAEEILETGMVDAIVRGEGEKTFCDLLDAWADGSDPAAIPGLICPSAHGITDTGDPDRIEDLDDLPFPARDLVDLSGYSQTRLGYRSLPPCTQAADVLMGAISAPPRGLMAPDGGPGVLRACWLNLNTSSVTWATVQCLSWMTILPVLRNGYMKFATGF